MGTRHIVVEPSHTHLSPIFQMSVLCLSVCLSVPNQTRVLIHFTTILVLYSTGNQIVDDHWLSRSAEHGLYCMYVLAS